MKIIRLTMLFFIFSFIINAQEKKNTEIITIDVNQNTKIIYVLGGIVSVITKEDLAFAKKYNLRFHDFGCLAPADFEFYETKNGLVFDDLNKKYGEQWQKEMKSNAMGFEKWKKK